MKLNPLFKIDLPQKLSLLREVASNLIWTAIPGFTELFESIDAKLFKSARNNPLELLNKLPTNAINKLSRDDSFNRKLKSLYNDHYNFEKYNFSDIEVAYFSPEFGLHESMEIYAGGLGILAGDLIKTSIQSNTKMCGMGIFYHDGFFYQKITKSLNQTTVYNFNNPSSLPLFQVFNDDDEPVEIKIRFADFDLRLKVLVVFYGPCPIFLLSSDCETNDNLVRDITSKLYTGERDERLYQEIALGTGGIRALESMQIKPECLHINEGHAAFAIIERAFSISDNDPGLFNKNLKILSESTVFTTHTPVIHGNEEFDPELVKRQFDMIYGTKLSELLVESGIDAQNPGKFSMTAFALMHSAKLNGVSKLHGKTSVKMWKHLWNNKLSEHPPIDYITNGVHAESWLSPEFRALFDKHFPEGWINQIDDKNLWVNLLTIPDEEIWKTKNLARKRMFEYIKFRYLNSKPLFLDRSFFKNIDDIFSDNKLTIGFARRFALYKRGDLLFRDVRRLKAIVEENRKGVQIVIAGKAHPMDVEGKAVLKIVLQSIREHELEKRVFFIDNYDMAIARMMVAGCDVWLNTPQRPLEACGTSGMKAALNGTINFSVLDGWWDEAYNHFNGFSIGRPSLADNSEESEIIEADWIYEILEKEIIPRFYDRHGKQPPANWLKLIKESFRTIPFKFNSYRMFKEYEEKFYNPILGKTLSEL